MPTAMTPPEFADWEPRQPIRFALVDGQPVRLPEGELAASRLSHVRTISARVFGDEGAVETWMMTSIPALGGLAPTDLALEDDEGCQMVLRLLVATGRTDGASHG